ncbi:hypothetical protein D3C85_822640 [compost metagenome]
MFDQLDLVGAGAVQLAAIDHLEMLGEVEMTGDLPREFPGLRCRDIQVPALPLKGVQQLDDPFEHFVLIQPRDLETLTVMVDCLPGLGLVETIELHERLQQRRADEVFQLGQVRFVDAEFGQGVLN